VGSYGRIHRRQRLQGNTIACGKKLVLLQSSSRGDAIDELTSILFGEDRFYGRDTDFEKITLYKVESSEVLPYQEWKREAHDKDKLAAFGTELKQELAEYERLKAKFGK